MTTAPWSPNHAASGTHALRVYSITTIVDAIEQVAPKLL